MAETSAASTSSGTAAATNVPPPSVESTETTVDAASSEQTSPPEDPEEDWGEGLKLKRSEVRDRLKRQKELERASHERFQKAAQARKEQEAREQQIKQALEQLDVDALLAQRGINANQWAEQRLTRELQRQQMTPEQRENETLRQRIQQIEREQQERAEQTRQEQLKANTDAYVRHFDQVIAQAMTSFGKLPKTPQAVSKVADVLTDYLDEAGNFTIDPKIAAEIAYENSATDARQMAESIVDSKDPRAGEMLADFLGPKVVAALQKHAIAKAQTQPTKPRPVQQLFTQPKTKAPLTLEEARKAAGLKF